MGIACLNLFVQHNWTGPTPRDWKLEDAGPLGDAISPLASTVPQKRAFELLSADNEDAYSLTRGPQLLVVALGILESLESALPTSSASFTPSLNWWKARALAIQQKTLDNPSATLYETILECMEKVEAALDQLPAEPDLLPFFYLEYGLVHHYHKQDQKAKDMFEKAQSASGLKWEMSGRLGKRTKFQERDHAQLVVVAESAGDAQPDAGKSVGVPEILPLNDELLLEKIAFKEDDGSKKSLRVVDQALLLAFWWAANRFLALL